MMPWIKSRIDLLGFLGNLARMAYKLADYPQMEIFTREALENAQHKGNIVAIIYYQRRLGLALVHQDKMVEALEWFNKSLDSAQEARDEYGIVAYVLYTGMLAERLGKDKLATHLLGAVDSLLEKLYKPFDLEDQEEYEKLTERVLDKIEPKQPGKEFTTAWKRGRKLTPAEAIQLVQSQLQVI